MRAPIVVSPADAAASGRRLFVTDPLPDVLATIDGALADYALSADAMRWTPEDVPAGVQIANLAHPPTRAEIAAAIDQTGFSFVVLPDGRVLVACDPARLRR
jgi:hypothetical protein